MLVKICGITSVDDARAAADAGAAAIGLNMVSGPRRIDADAVKRIVNSLSAFATPILLTDVQDGRIPQDSGELIQAGLIHCVQLYGNITRQTLDAFHNHGVKTMPVIHLRDGDPNDPVDSLLNACHPHSPAALLFDAAHPQMAGGTGTRLDWQSIAARLQRIDRTGWPPIVLAGGLTPENVGEAIRIVRPWAVDVSSGVESSPGRKDLERMRAFVRAAMTSASA